MKEIKMVDLYPRESALQVLGIICKDTQKLRKSNLQPKDFNDEFHRTLLGAINNIVYGEGNPKEIIPSEVDTFLTQYVEHHERFKKSGGVGYLYAIMENANVDSYDMHYNRVKKFSLLRDFYKNGIDISDLYAPIEQNTDIVAHQEKMKRFDEMSIGDVVEHYNNKFVKLRSEWSVTKESKNFKAGEGVRKLLASYKESPTYGEPYSNGYMNTLFRGKVKGKFLIRSGGTGTGKTFSSLIDACDLGCTHIYDYETRMWLPKPNSVKPTLLISTEIDKDELQVNMISYISGIAVSVIKNGRYSQEVEKRLDEAVSILETSPIHIVYIPDFSISDIENIIEEYILEHGVEYVYFDYIQITPKLARTMASSYGMNLREDQILVNFAQALKTIAEKFDVFMCSSTQLNRNYKDEDNRDATCLRGGMATSDKCDYGWLMFKVRAKDKAKIKGILDSKDVLAKFGKEPNMSHWIFKNRGGDTDVIVWTYRDTETMRETPLFVTDYDFNLLNNFEPTRIQLTD